MYKNKKQTFPIVYHTLFFERKEEDSRKILNLFSFCDTVIL